MDSHVDTHFHVYDLARFSLPWPTADQPAIFRTFSLAEYESEIQGTPVKYAVFVQVLNRNPEEAEWVLKQCKDYPFVKGVVAGLDLESEQLESSITTLSQYPEFVGCRHILDLEEPDWISRDSVSRGLSVLENKGLTFDLLLRPHLLKYIPGVVKKHPGLKFVVNHIAKPLIKDGVVDGWKEDMTEIASYPNVWCKISGLITEADFEAWTPEDFKVYIEHILSIFGEDRIMFGSDWPVFKQCRDGTYGRIHRLAQELTDNLSESARQKLFRDNAVRFYNLKV